MATPEENALAFRKAQVEEYSQYVAAYDIPNSTGVLVYGRGYPIPASNVQKDGSVVLLRHACPGPDKVTNEACPIEHNAVLETTDPGAAVRVAKASTGKAAS